MIKPGVAVVLDTETTALDGIVIEVAVIDAATGKTLLDTLVCTADERIDPTASKMHGLSAVEVAGAPVWHDVLPGLLDATRNSRILAWKAEFDAEALLRTCERYGDAPAHLAHPYAGVARWSATGRGGSSADRGAWTVAIVPWKTALRSVISFFAPQVNHHRSRVNRRLRPLGTPGRATVTSRIIKPRETPFP